MCKNIFIKLVPGDNNNCGKENLSDAKYMWWYGKEKSYVMCVTILFSHYIINLVSRK